MNYILILAFGVMVLGTIGSAQKNVFVSSDDSEQELIEKIKIQIENATVVPELILGLKAVRNQIIQKDLEFSPAFPMRLGAGEVRFFSLN